MRSLLPLLVLLAACASKPPETWAPCLDRLESAQPTTALRCVMAHVKDEECSKAAVKVLRGSFGELRDASPFCAKSICEQSPAPLQCAAPATVGADLQTITNQSELYAAILARDSKVDRQATQRLLARLFSETTEFGASVPPLRGRTAPVLTLAELDGALRLNGTPVDPAALSEVLQTARVANPETVVLIKKSVTPANAVTTVDAAKNVRLSVSAEP